MLTAIAFTGVAPAATADSASPSAPLGSATQLGPALAAQGWVGTRQPDGSMLYRRSPEQTTTAPATGNRSPASQLQQQLQARGWTREQAADGSMLYRPPQRRGPSQGKPAVEGKAPSASLAEQLRQQFEAMGWTARPTADGTLYYRAPAPVPQPAATPGLAEALRDQLVQQGWVGSQAPDGSTIYRQGRSTLPSTQGSHATAAQSLHRQLLDRGWSAVPDAHGNRLYLPPGTSPPARDGSPEPAQGSAATSTGPGSLANPAYSAAQSTNPSPVAERQPTGSASAGNMSAPSSTGAAPDAGRQATTEETKRRPAAQEPAGERESRAIDHPVTPPMHPQQARPSAYGYRRPPPAGTVPYGYGRYWYPGYHLAPHPWQHPPHGAPSVGYPLHRR
jgi:hypothetical protein